jgi:hypothetical protein
VLKGIFGYKRRGKKGLLENCVIRIFIMCTLPLSAAGTFTFTK